MAQTNDEMQRKILRVIIDNSGKDSFSQHAGRSILQKLFGDISKEQIDFHVLSLGRKGLVELTMAGSGSGSGWIFAKPSLTGVNLTYAYSVLEKEEKIILYQCMISSQMNLILTNRRLFTVNQIMIEDQTRLEDIAEAYSWTYHKHYDLPISAHILVTTGATYLRIRLENNDEKIFDFGGGGQDHAPSMINRYVNAINMARLLLIISNTMDRKLARELNLAN